MYIRSSFTVLLVLLGLAEAAKHARHTHNWYEKFQQKVNQRLEKRLLVNPLKSSISGTLLL
jgi:sulfite exporter TauE/SafE